MKPHTLLIYVQARLHVIECVYHYIQIASEGVWKEVLGVGAYKILTRVYVTVHIHLTHSR